MMEWFAQWPPAVLIVCGIVGLLIGSFLNVVVYRLPIMMQLQWQRERSAASADPIPMPAHIDAERFSLWWPPSTCPKCNSPIKPYQNIPVISYLFLRARCATCQAPIAKRYPLVEAFVALASVAVAWRFGATWTCVAALFLTWTLIAAALIDIDHYLLPDSLTLPLMWAGIIISLFSIDGIPILASLQDSVIGAIIGYLSLWSVFHLFKLLTGKEGMGYGDFKLLAALGAWLGWQMLPLVIMLSALLGTIIGVGAILLKNRSRHQPIPFGPFLAIGGWMALLFGDRLLDAWLNFML